MEILQEPGTPNTWAGTVPPIKEKEVVPEVVTMPPQVVEALTGVLRYKFAGKVSVNAAGLEERINGKEFGL